VDRDWTDAVWNYPVVSYRVKQFALRPYRNQDGSPTKWARPDAASGATHGARVVLEVDYLNESYFSYQPLKETNSDHIETFTYEYELELAAGADGVQGTKDDVILGGEWISRNRPDFAWKL